MIQIFRAEYTIDQSDLSIERGAKFTCMRKWSKIPECHRDVLPTSVADSRTVQAALTHRSWPAWLVLIGGNLYYSSIHSFACCWTLIYVPVCLSLNRDWGVTWKCFYALLNRVLQEFEQSYDHRTCTLT